MNLHECGTARKAAPDGYTVLFAANSAIVATNYIFKNPPLDAPLRELEPAAQSTPRKTLGFETPADRLRLVLH